MNKNELVIGRSSYTVRFCNLTPVPALKMIKIIIPWNWVCYCLTKAIWILLFLVIIVEWSIVERCYDKCSYIFLFTISMNNSPTAGYDHLPHQNLWQVRMESVTTFSYNSYDFYWIICLTLSYEL